MARPAHRTRALSDVYVKQAHTPAHGEHWAGPEGMVERIATLIDVRAGHHVLDVGCGVGGPARRLATLCRCDVVALDLVEPVVAIAAARSEAANAIAFVVASAEALPFEAGAFDRILCLGVIAHLRDRVSFAREAWRVLRRDGVLCVSEAFWDGARSPRFAAFAPQPWHAVTTPRLVTELRSARFADVRVLPWPGWDLSSPSDLEDPSLRADVLGGRLWPRLVVATKG